MKSALNSNIKKKIISYELRTLWFILGFYVILFSALFFMHVDCWLLLLGITLMLTLLIFWKVFMFILDVKAEDYELYDCEVLSCKVHTVGHSTVASVKVISEGEPKVLQIKPSVARYCNEKTHVLIVEGFSIERVYPYKILGVSEYSECIKK